MEKNTLVHFANLLWEAERTREGIQALTEIQPGLTVEEAYQVQLHNIDKKCSNGQRVIGKKIGLTSFAMQELLGVDQPDYGHLLDDMIVENHGEVPYTRVMQPRVEGEVAFVLKADLIGPAITVEDVLAATDYVLPAIEVVDSRIENWQIKLADTIADNASCGLFILGDSPVKVSDIDLPKLSMKLQKNDSFINAGVGADVLGHPAEAVAWLANKLHGFGIPLKKGEIILSGALSAAVDAHPGDLFTIHFEQLGDVSVRFL